MFVFRIPANFFGRHLCPREEVGIRGGDGGRLEGRGLINSEAVPATCSRFRFVDGRGSYVCVNVYYVCVCKVPHWKC